MPRTLVAINKTGTATSAILDLAHVPAGATADVSKIQTAPQANISQSEMDSINRAGVY